MTLKTTLKSHSHSVFRLYYHLVLVTKYRRKALSGDMLKSAEEIVTRLCESWEYELVELSGEADHLHILFEAHPGMELAKFVNNLKTVTSRLLRRDYGERLARFYYKPVLWSGSYCILSTGGAPIEVIKRYLESQETPP
ncbi:MAG: IS200/IS605 family transposase [Deinococcota bacterium]|nr:IS200/IS605 family transposase [Deinococcota bacterium]